METIEKLDQEVFLYLNDQHHPFWDIIMTGASDKYFWIPFYGLLVAYLVYRYRWQSLPMLGLAIAAIGMADFIASGIFKPYFARLRPCHDPAISETVNFIKGCGGRFGFMSSHASTAFALAVFYNLILSDRYVIFKIILIVWAVVVSYSRIYLGVHYPGDLLAGALLGSLLAYLCSLGYSIILVRYPQLVRLTENK